ncbi:NACHT domain-containing protein [Streptomyces hydrogenans]|uniref:NACHT domain-containing protein n=1 Tax=Streptomyces hydrogenans TaxID=1873719 RepID=UPI003D7209F4
MKFNLYHLGPREFENLVQSIAVAELGPRVSVFGAGPDGGREATFEDVNVSPSGGKAWQGYGILQVKHKEVAESRTEEAKWLISEIRKEFGEWRKSSKRNPKPKYVIFATNVTLSAAPTVGGFDRVSEVMREECKKLDIEDWIIWHSENINRFLEIHDGIRKSYAAWILPGDVLSALYEDQERKHVEVVGAIKSFLSREILRERFANLDQAGSADDRTIPLADVFVDLPISVADEFQRNSETKCLETLIAACDAEHRSIDSQAASLGFQSNRFVLVGGPGQGKSTVSQLLCQLYRALLIKETELYARNAELRSTVDRVTALADRESLSPRARRWPLKIPLTSLADGIAKGDFGSILEYISQRITAVSAVPVAATDLKKWLADFPWLLILDGLDEVPGSSNRDEVLNCINDFLLDAAEVNADLVVVATTRPQGYADEFSPKYYRHYALQSLDQANALSYGNKLAQARYGSAADDKVQRLMDRLEQASAEDSTAHLMTTPLQVTIMAVLLDRMGKAPKDRYTLFAEYYRVIYERELEKEGPANNLLRDRRTDINAIHADIGLLLQTKSERSGDTASRLTLDELRQIIATRLEDEGFKGDSLKSLTSSIIRAALDRLVFLVPSRVNEVSFEIRSLQEFWAADAIMNCREVEIPKRLRSMSVSSHWRNVLLFALGNIFENRKPLRDTIVALVSELNSKSDRYGNLQRRVLTGSRLAVEILRDGMVRAPRYETMLLEEALRVLELAPSSHVSLLAASISEDGMEIAKDFLRSELSEGTLPRASTLIFLGVRASLDDPWAAEVLRRIYAESTPKDRRFFMGVAAEAENATLSAWVMPAMADPDSTFFGARSMRMVIAMGRSIARTQNRGVLSSLGGPFSFPEWAFPASQVFTGPQPPSAARLSFSTPRMMLKSFVNTCEHLNSRIREAVEAGFPESHWLSKISKFSANPCRESLADIIRVEGPNLDDYRYYASRFPWIVLYALKLREEFGEDAVGMVDSGWLGDTADWLALEESWQTSDFDSMIGSTFESWRSSKTPFFPFEASRFSVTTSERNAWDEVDVSYLVSLMEAMPDAHSRQSIAGTIFDLPVRHGNQHPRNDLTASLVERMLACLPAEPQSLLMWLDDVEIDETWIDLLNSHGVGIRAGYHWGPRIPQFLVEAWVGDFSKVGIGRIVMSATSGAVFTRHGLEIKAEWELVKCDPHVDPARKFLAALAVLTLECPHERDDVDLLLETLNRSVREREFPLFRVFRLMRPGQELADYEFLVNLFDSNLHTLQAGEDRMAFDFLVRYQSTQWTEISFERMRPI